MPAGGRADSGPRTSPGPSADNCAETRCAAPPISASAAAPSASSKRARGPSPNHGTTWCTAGADPAPAQDRRTASALSPAVSTWVQPEAAASATLRQPSPGTCASTAAPRAPAGSGSVITVTADSGRGASSRTVQASASFVTVPVSRVAPVQASASATAFVRKGSRTALSTRAGPGCASDARTSVRAREACHAAVPSPRAWACRTSTASSPAVP